MAERKEFRIRTSRSIHGVRRRGAFRIAATVRPQAHGTGGPERGLDDAEKIYQSLVLSGRLTRKK